MIELLSKVADVMRRCDALYCESHSVVDTTDSEWDAVLAEVEDAVDSGVTQTVIVKLDPLVEKLTDSLRLAVDRLKTDDAAIAMLERYASECGECAGVGITIEDEDCKECADIRAVITKAKGTK